jgi:hypothetical protein
VAQPLTPVESNSIESCYRAAPRTEAICPALREEKPGRRSGRTVDWEGSEGELCVEIRFRSSTRAGNICHRLLLSILTAISRPRIPAPYLRRQHDHLRLRQDCLYVGGAYLCYFHRKERRRSELGPYLPSYSPQLSAAVGQKRFDSIHHTDDKDSTYELGVSMYDDVLRGVELFLYV